VAVIHADMHGSVTLHTLASRSVVFRCSHCSISICTACWSSRNCGARSTQSGSCSLCFSSFSIGEGIDREYHDFEVEKIIDLAQGMHVTYFWWKRKIYNLALLIHQNTIYVPCDHLSEVGTTRTHDRSFCDPYDRMKPAGSFKTKLKSTKYTTAGFSGCNIHRQQLVF
jgi:hypothetical protein